MTPPVAIGSVGRRTITQATRANVYGLTPEQFEVASAVALPKSQRSDIATLCAKVGINKTTYYRWLAIPEVDRVRRELARAYFADDVPEVVEALVKKAKQGDVFAARLLLEWAKELDDTSRTLNVRISFGMQEVEEKLKKMRRNVIDAEIAAPAATGRPETGEAPKVEPTPYAPVGTEPAAA